jgi:hypothetical protein
MSRLVASHGASRGDPSTSGTDTVTDARAPNYTTPGDSPCAMRLLEWFDAGWIDLYDPRDGNPSNRSDISGPPATRNGHTGLIDRDRARRLPGAWSRWSDEDDETWQCVHSRPLTAAYASSSNPSSPPRDPDCVAA